MIVDYFNFWHFAFIGLSILSYYGLYRLLKNKSDSVKKWTLFGILSFGLLLHFLKMFFPPYSENETRLYNDIWFINICGANILIFPIILLTKSKHAKDYMFFIGLLSGLIAVCYPIEPILKGDNQIAEILDVLRFYIHHTILWIVPLSMVTLKLHNISYKSVFSAPTGLLLLMLFIVLNQVFQYELGSITPNTTDFFGIKFKNSSYIWGPDDSIGYFIAKFCPKIFKTVPVGEFAGQTKYWPWFWLIVPAYLIITPLCFGISMIFDWNNFKSDMTRIFNNVQKLVK